MKQSLYYRDEAVRDLQQIWAYNAERAGERIANDLLRRIHTTIEMVIADHPRAGRERPELGENLRSFSIVPHIVFYSVEPRRILIVRIVHGYRDIRPPLISLLVEAKKTA